jgi:hypothetical protein
MNEELKKQQEEFLAKMESKMQSIVDNAIKGVITKEDVTAQVNEAIKAFEGEFKVKASEEVNELAKQVKTLGENIAKMKSYGFTNENISQFAAKVDEMMESEQYKNFVANRCKSTGRFDNLTMKDVSMTNDYQGNVLIAQQSDRIVSQVGHNKQHMKDVITTLDIEPEHTSIAYTQIYHVDRNARYAAENGTLPESSFKIKEMTAGLNRVGHHIRISKRMLKSRAYVRSFILNLMPEAVFNAMDAQILFGDGSGENPLGITRYEGVLPVETIISTAIYTGAAGSVDSIESRANNTGIVVVLKDPIDIMRDGMQITFGASDSSISYKNALNGQTFEVIKETDTRLIIDGVAYSGEEAHPELISFTINHGAFKSVETPNSQDALEAAVAVMTYGEFVPSAIVINPITLFQMLTEKDTTGRRLEFVKDAFGNLVVGGVPVISTNAVPTGKYFIGDFRNGVNLVTYTQLNIEFVEGVDEKLRNQTVCIAQMELMMPVYCPWAFAYGSVSALKTALTKA